MGMCTQMMLDGATVDKEEMKTLKNQRRRPAVCVAALRDIVVLWK